jgi:YidC/Oxa1 family membrane protein insertase
MMSVRRLPLLASLLILLVLSVPQARGEAVQLIGLRQNLFVNLNGGLPARWESCAGPCAEAGPGVLLLRASAGGGDLRWEVPGDEGATRRLNDLVYEAVPVETPSGPAVILSSRDPFGGIRLVHRYRLDALGHVLEASLQVPAGARLVLAGGAELVPEKLPGLGSIYSDARAVRIGADGQETLTGDGSSAAGDLVLGPGEWAGIRGRFWTVLLQSPSALTVAASEAEADRPEVSIGRSGDETFRSGILDLRFYGGPVERLRLKAVDPALTGMLYAALWDWLRAGSFGLAWILERWQGLVGSYGLAILLLSLTVKVLMWPLTAVAERWQDQVNRIQSRLQPELAAIGARRRKGELNGEEAHRETLEVYRRHGVSPWFTLKSLAGFLIQIPVFIAAFDMLGEHFGLAGQSFLWVTDLALPDRAMALPWVLPFAGGHLNLLPFVMTAFTVAAARLQEDASLAPALRQAQRLKLYAMAALFFVLLYTFPAGMVLYWTANNALHLVKVLADRWRRS